MAATGLEVRVHEGRERVEAARVARTLTEVVGSLREIDRVHLLHGTRATWVMADMERQAQDLVMRLEARLVPAGRDMADLQLAGTWYPTRANMKKRLGSADGTHLAAAVRLGCEYLMTHDEGFPVGDTVNGVQVVRPNVVWPKSLLDGLDTDSTGP